MKRHFKTEVEICILGVIRHFLVLDLTHTVQRRLDGLPTVFCQHQIFTFIKRRTRAWIFSTTFQSLYSPRAYMACLRMWSKGFQAILKTSRLYYQKIKLKSHSLLHAQMSVTLPPCEACHSVFSRGRLFINHWNMGRCGYMSSLLYKKVLFFLLQTHTNSHYMPSSLISSPAVKPSLILLTALWEPPNPWQRQVIQNFAKGISLLWVQMCAGDLLFQIMHRSQTWKSHLPALTKLLPQNAGMY